MIEVHSPSKLVWLRLKKNKPAIAGLSIILFFSLTAVFCYLIIPDKTVDSNQMSLPLSMQKPGFEVDILLTDIREAENRSVLNKAFRGKETSFSLTPIQSWHFEKGNFVYAEFTGDAGEPGMIHTVALEEITGKKLSQKEQEEEITTHPHTT